MKHNTRVYYNSGKSVPRRSNRNDDTAMQQKNAKEAQLSKMRNNKTVLPVQQQVALGADGETYAVQTSDRPFKKNHRPTSKKVAQNQNLTESGMGNFSAEHASNVNNVRSAATDFSDFLVRSAIWWMAQGWYAAIRKAYISMGPASQNDKYFVNLPNPFPTHRDAIYFLDSVLMVCYNNMRGRGQVLDFKIPKHLSFGLAILATKQLQRTPTGVIDMATQPDITFTVQYVTQTYQTYVAYLNEVVALPAHPFVMTCNIELESPTCVYHNSKGEAVHSVMKLEEIASVYGYFVPLGGIINGVPKDVFNYDYNGFDHPSSTQLLRTAFFKLETTSYVPNLELNPQLLPNQFVDPRLVMLNFAATGFVPTSEHTMYCIVQHMSTVIDANSVYASSQGLDYITQKMNSYGFGAPLVSPNPLAYNCALDLAQALQTQVANFCSVTGLNTDPRPVFNENEKSWAVAVAQYIEKIPLPSVIFEETKNFSDINSWTMAGKPEPIAMYYKYNSIYNQALGPNAPVPGSMTINQYFANVSLSMPYMMEIRSFVRLNMAPEINNFMPSVHLMVKDSSNRIYSILDPEAFHHKDIAMWINYSYIPSIPENRPLPLTYIEVKNVDDSAQILRMYQMCFDSSYQGKSSELDNYYQRLREKQIGFFGALSSILGAVLPAVPHLVSAIFKPKAKKQEAPVETTKSTFSTGALVQSLLQSLVNNKDFKQVAVNAPDQTRTMKDPMSKKRVLNNRPAVRKLMRRRALARLGR